MVCTQTRGERVIYLRNHHRGRGLCEQIKPSQRALARGLGSAHKAQDQGDGSYSNTVGKQMVAILVAMGSGLWLAHQDWAGFGQLTKTGNQVI